MTLLQLDPSAASQTVARSPQPTATIVQRQEQRQQIDALKSEQLRYRTEAATVAPESPRQAVIAKQLLLADERVKLLEFRLQTGIPGTLDLRPASTLVPGSPATLPPLPDGYVVLGSVLLLVTLLPLSVALARRIWRQASQPTSMPSRETDGRLRDVQMAVDSIALEVERLGESQRFVAERLHRQLNEVATEQRSRMPDAVPKQDLRHAVTPHWTRMTPWLSRRGPSRAACAA